MVHQLSADGALFNHVNRKFRVALFNDKSFSYRYTENSDQFLADIVNQK